MLISSKYSERFPGVEYRESTTFFGIKYTKKYYFWQSSFDGAFDYHYTIVYDIFQKLTNYDFKDGYSLNKYYESADEAIKDLENAYRL